MDMDKSTLDIFFNNDSFLNGYLKKDDYAIPHETIIISMVLDTFVLDEILMKICNIYNSY